MDGFTTTTLIAFVAIVFAFVIGHSNGRNSAPSLEPVVPSAAPAITAEAHEAVLVLLRKCDKLIWMMAAEAGGKVIISSATEANHNPSTARLRYGQAAGGEMTIEVIACAKA